MRYEVFVSIIPGTPPKNSRLPSAVSFFVDADNEFLAVKKALELSEKMKLLHPRLYKGACFIPSSPSPLKI